MRYIDLDQLIGDPEVQPLIDSADAARAALLAEADSAKRKKLIEDNRNKWVVFRESFEKIAGPKCWYTESRNPGTDDDIDHFRPKGRLAEDVTHEGYWWEALNWRNFRLSSHRANRLRHNPDTDATHGKGEHFPLLNEPDRCRLPTDDLSRECPTLLDPTEPGDPPLLTFNTNGTVGVSPEYSGDDDVVKRIDDSRIYLHLEWPAFVEDRRDLYKDISQKVTNGDASFARIKNGENSHKPVLASIARDLIRLTRKGAAYSRASKTYILMFRNKEWIKRTVIPHIDGET